MKKISDEFVRKSEKTDMKYSKVLSYHLHKGNVELNKESVERFVPRRWFEMGICSSIHALTLMHLWLYVGQVNMYNVITVL